MRGPITLAKQAKGILQTEGLAILLKKILISLTRFKYESHLLFEHALEEGEDVKEFYIGLSAVGAKKSYRAVKHYKRRKRWL